MLVRILPLVALGSLLLACSGGTTGITSGGDGGGDGGTDGGSCVIDQILGKRVCVPGKAKAGVTITVEAEGVGCAGGCGVTMEDCKVEVSGSIVTVSLAAKSCSQPEGTACPAVCGVPLVKCELPPLPAGTYTVQTKGDAAQRASHELVVAADATDTSCKLSLDGTAPTLAAKDFAQSCTVDGDCEVVQEGSACAVCGCANAAIAKSADDAWKTADRAASSQCAAGLQAGIMCAACREVLPKCDQGTCKAVPTNN